MKVLGTMLGLLAAGFFGYSLMAGATGGQCPVQAAMNSGGDSSCCPVASFGETEAVRTVAVADTTQPEALDCGKCGDKGDKGKDKLGEGCKKGKDKGGCDKGDKLGEGCKKGDKGDCDKDKLCGDGCKKGDKDKLGEGCKKGKDKGGCDKGDKLSEQSVPVLQEQI